MKTLASQIEYETGRGRTHCAIYENELQRLWPLDRKDREAKIAQFAEEYGSISKVIEREQAATRVTAP